MVAISTLRPGILVSLKTSLRGNVLYATREIETEHRTDAGQLRAQWETTRVVQDPEEHEAGVKARSAARGAIIAICAQSAFGLLCPESRRSELDAAIREAREIVGRFNDGARLSRVDLYVIAGRVAEDDAEAIRAINSEVSELIGQMEAGLRNLDARAVREAASKAKALSGILTPDAERKTAQAIEAARRVAREIVKAGEGVSVEIDRVTLERLQAARTAFLEIPEEGAPEPEIVTGSTVTARAVELDAMPDESTAPPPAAFRPPPSLFDLEV
jgi:hypothetical protein